MENQVPDPYEMNNQLMAADEELKQSEKIGLMWDIAERNPSKMPDSSSQLSWESDEEYKQRIEFQKTSAKVNCFVCGKEFFTLKESGNVMCAVCKGEKV